MESTQLSGSGAAAVKTKILIVDDRPENILALKMLLESESASADVLSARDAQDALGLILQHEFGLALLDVQMPVVSGFELARLMRGTSRSRHIPIIFVTAGQPESQSVFEGYEKGAVDFLYKPLDPNIVRSKVRVFIELDQQKRTLQQLKNSAESASLAKTRFLANMSHEIRTPLAAVLGFSELLSQDDVTEDDRRSYVDAISRNGKALAKLIDDVLDLTKIEAGKMEVELSDVKLDELLSELSVWELRARDKGLHFRVDVEPDVPEMFQSDSVKLRQVLTNLLGNAFKFTNQGSVTLTVQLMPREDGEPLLGFLVSDTGCGMESGALTRLFQPFTQADSSTTRKFGGTGLGLAISRQIARALGGDVVAASSTVGEGSSFLATLDPGDLTRAASKSRERPSEATEPRLDGASILVIDDSPDILKLVTSLLKRWGANPLPVGGPKQGLEAAAAQNFDLIVTDLQMPEMDGYEVVRRLRASGFERPIVALTAHALREDLDRCLAVGCNGCISKPINQAALLHLLNSMLQQTP